MELERWKSVMEVNLTGQFLCARGAIREFRRRGVVSSVSCSAGKIICISSVHELIPMDEFQRGKTGDELVLGVDKQQLEDAEGFAQAQWPAMDDPFWGQRPDMHLVRASELLGLNLQGRSGDDVGEIEEVTVSLEDGEVSGIAVDRNEGGRIEIQQQALARGEDEGVVLDMSAAQLSKRAKG